MSDTEVKTVYKAGEYVSYRKDGICQITDIRTENMSGLGERKYYILQPVYSAQTQLFIPTDSPELSEHMRRIMTKQEIDEVINAAEDRDLAWIEDSKQRYSVFVKYLDCSDRREALWVFKILSLHKEEVEKVNRKFYATDERLLDLAEKIITDEFSFVLGIEKDEVLPYIIEQIKNGKNDA